MGVQASQVRTTVNAPPLAVWKALTSASTLKQFFFGSDISTDWRVGSPILFRGAWNGKPYEDRGTIQTFDAGKRLAFTHWSPLSGMEDRPENYHIVTFDIRPTGDGTEVVLTQTNQHDAKPLTEQDRKEYAKNWTMVLDGLKKTVKPPSTGRRNRGVQRPEVLSDRVIGDDRSSLETALVSRRHNSPMVAGVL
ncbi:MAG: hypothetical protein PVSMB1_09990 [Gemmatimonadaceae bacterium]